MKSVPFHILNPNKQHASAVASFVKRHPELHYKWVRRESHPTHLETLVEWAYNEGYQHCVVWGGDGSFSRAAQVLFERGWFADMTLTLVPVGTCNDFARVLKISDWRAWAKQFLSAKRKTMLFDVGVVESAGKKRVFLNNAGFGRPASNATTKPKPIRDILHLTEKTLSIEWESDNHHEFQTISALFMIVFNAPYFSKGLFFSNDVRPQDGFLDAYIVPPRPRWRLLQRFILARFGAPLYDPAMMYFDAAIIHVQISEKVTVQVDGEVAFSAPTDKLSFLLDQHKIKIAVPLN